MRTTSQRFTQLRRGLLELAVLELIASNTRSFYGKEILQRLTETEFAVPKGTLYPLLSKMRHEKILVSYYEEDDFGGRKYYYLTIRGKKLLRELEAYWKLLNDSLEKLRAETQ